MITRPSVPARLRGSHPRRADGRFMSRASARGQITRLTTARQRFDRRHPRPLALKPTREPKAPRPRARRPAREPEGPSLPERPTREPALDEEPPEPDEDLYEDLDDWISDFDRFVDDVIDEIAGGFDTGKKGKK